MGAFKCKIKALGTHLKNRNEKKKKENGERGRVDRGGRNILIGN